MSERIVHEAGPALKDAPPRWMSPEDQPLWEKAVARAEEKSGPGAASYPVAIAIFQIYKRRVTSPTPQVATAALGFPPSELYEADRWSRALGLAVEASKSDCEPCVLEIYAALEEQEVGTKGIELNVVKALAPSLGALMSKHGVKEESLRTVVTAALREMSPGFDGVLGAVLKGDSSLPRDWQSYIHLRLLGQVTNEEAKEPVANIGGEPAPLPEDSKPEGVEKEAQVKSEESTPKEALFDGVTVPLPEESGPEGAEKYAGVPRPVDSIGVQGEEDPNKDGELFEEKPK